MFEYLQPADKPVIEDLKEFEVIFAKEQPQYIPLRALKSNGAYGEVLSRWSLTEEQRKAVADGADIFLELSTFHHALQPIRMAIGEPNAKDFKESYGFNNLEKENENGKQSSSN